MSAVKRGVSTPTRRVLRRGRVRSDGTSSAHLRGHHCRGCQNHNVRYPWATASRKVGELFRQLLPASDAGKAVWSNIATKT